jgi:hypothetical protein
MSETTKTTPPPNDWVERCERCERADKERERERAHERGVPTDVDR